MPISPQQKIDKNNPSSLRNGYNLDIPYTKDIPYLNRFPMNLGDDKENTQAILFKFHSPIPGAGAPKNSAISGPNQYLALPLPAELPFTDSYNYDDSSLQDYYTWIKNMISRAAQNIGSIASGDGVDLSNRKNGVEFNSQAALTFKNPVFRTFTFSWEFIAKDSVEILTIQSIVSKFRIAAASSFQNGDSTSKYIEYPDMVSFVIYPGGSVHPFPASYPCFIESVNYAPISHDGQIPFFKDNMPLGWKLSLTLKESMYLDKLEISDGSGYNNAWEIQGF